MISDFAAIDFETANAQRGSPCALGVVTVSEGKIMSRKKWLMRPPPSVDYFDQCNVNVHGITPKMVASKPRFGDLLDDVMKVIDGRMVVAHNAGFDLSVLRYACEESGLNFPRMSFLCTMVLSRTILDIETYSLPRVAQELGIELKGHHDPLADAECTARVLIYLAERVGAATIEDLLRKQSVCIGYFQSGIWRGSHKIQQSSSQKMYLPRASTVADSDNFLYGELVVLTGKLPYGISRRTAWDTIASLGGQPQQNITKKTTLIVIGEWDSVTLIPGMNSSSKYRKAMALRQAGQDIEIMNGHDFVALMDEALEERKQTQQ